MEALAHVVKKWPLLQNNPVAKDLLASGELDGVDGEAAEQAWTRLRTEVLSPDQPFELHQQLFSAVFHSWQQATRGPPPVWSPQQQEVAGTNVARFMSHFHGDLRWEALRTGRPSADWQLLQQVSCANPDVFWGAVLRELGLRFDSPPSRILQEGDPTRPDTACWLPGARFNAAAAALFSAKVADASRPAITWADEAAPTQLHHVSWAELRQRAMHAAAAVAARFQPGAALAIAMPLNVEAAVIYLGVVAAGCAVVGIADSFAAPEVAARLDIAGAAAVFTQDVVVRGGKVLPLYRRVIGASSVPAIVLPADGDGSSSCSGGGTRPPVELRPGDISWSEFLATPTGAAVRPLPHISDASSLSNILFSSGTTGAPKAIPWTHVTPLRAAVDGWSLQDIRPDDVVAWPTSLGWMMGPWLLYAAWINGATVALYHGSPLGRDFGEWVAAARVNVLGVVPSIVKAWRSSGCMTHLDWSAIKAFSSTGEASSPDDSHWLSARVPGYRPVVEYCGGTEIGGGFLAGCLLQPQVPSAFSTPTLGASLVLLTSDGQQSPHTCPPQPATGELALVAPMLGSSQALLNRDHAKTYFGGMPALGGTTRPLRRHGDEVARLPGGCYRALGRVDDTMNLGGIKVSSVELERVVMAHVRQPPLAEVAAVAAPDAGGGPERLHLFVVLAAPGGPAAAAGPELAAALQAAAQAALRAHLNPLFKVDKVLLVAALPRTASNKVMRRVLKDQLLAARAKL